MAQVDVSWSVKMSHEGQELYFVNGILHTMEKRILIFSHVNSILVVQPGWELQVLSACLNLSALSTCRNSLLFDGGICSVHANRIADEFLLFIRLPVPFHLCSSFLQGTWLFIKDLHMSKLNMHHTVFASPMCTSFKADMNRNLQIAKFSLQEGQLTRLYYAQGGGQSKNKGSCMRAILCLPPQPPFN